MTTTFAPSSLDGEHLRIRAIPSQGEEEEEKDLEQSDKPSSLEITDEAGNVLRRGGNVGRKCRVATPFDPGAGRYLIRIPRGREFRGTV